MRRMLLAATAAIVTLAATTPALAGAGFITTYYFDAGHTQVAGYVAEDCTGHLYVYGTETTFSSTQIFSC